VLNSRRVNKLRFYAMSLALMQLTAKRWTPEVVGVEYEREVTLLNRLKCMAARHFARV